MSTGLRIEFCFRLSASFKLIRPVGQFEFFIGLDEYFTFLYFFFNLDQFRFQVNLSERSEQKNKKKPIVSRKQKKINRKIQTGKTKKKFNLDWFQFKVYKINWTESNRTFNNEYKDVAYNTGFTHLNIKNVHFKKIQLYKLH